MQFATIDTAKFIKVLSSNIYGTIYPTFTSAMQVRIVFVGILLYLTFKYRPQIENFLKTKFKSKKVTSANVEAGREVVSQENKQQDKGLIKILAVRCKLR